MPLVLMGMWRNGHIGKFERQVGQRDPVMLR